MNLFDPQGQCPVCHSAWVKDGTRLYVCRNGLFDIDNMHTVQLLAPFSGAFAYIVKHLPHETEIWWREDGTCEIKLSRYQSLKVINFTPPFDVSYERLKRLLLFS